MRPQSGTRAPLCQTLKEKARQPSPAGHHKDQPLASRFVPFVAHFGGREPDSFKFLFYTPNCSNSYSPFYTAQRPTCGYHFCHDTDHTKKVTDVSSANIMKWRPSPPSQAHLLPSWP
uniref:Uncharacterized protein n=1 Tax=Anas zonorhyncha TaxID=75864 RepID=A0A8B9UZM0_9AVES